MSEHSDVQWNAFNFPDIFKIEGGFYNKKPKEDSLGNLPFLGATDSNNGITKFYSFEKIRESSKTGSGKNHDLKDKIFDGNCICVTNDGSVGYAYYQIHNFTCSHSVNVLYSKSHTLNIEAATFLVKMIEQQKVCFQYSRKWRPIRMMKSKLMLPTTPEGKPDWDYMESEGKKLINRKQKKYLKYAKRRLDDLEYKAVVGLGEKEWKEFFISTFFNSIQRGKRLTKPCQVSGNTPYVSSTSLNNGIDNYISNEDDVRVFKNCLSIANSGSVGETFFHPYKFVASDHVTHLKNNKLSRFEYLFIATQLRKLSLKYNFNREINDKRVSKEKIMLPATPQGDPDWSYMEQYMMSLEYKKLQRYVDYTTFKSISYISKKFKISVSELNSILESKGYLKKETQEEADRRLTDKESTGAFRLLKITDEATSSGAGRQGKPLNDGSSESYSYLWDIYELERLIEESGNILAA